MKASLIPCGFETICLLQSHQAQMLQPRVVRLVLSPSPSEQPGFCRVNGLTASLDWQQDEQDRAGSRGFEEFTSTMRFHGQEGEFPENPWTSWIHSALQTSPK